MRDGSQARPTAHGLRPCRIGVPRFESGSSHGVVGTRHPPTSEPKTMSQAKSKHAIETIADADGRIETKVLQAPQITS